MRRIPLGPIVIPARAGQPATTIGSDELLREILMAGGERGLTTPELLTSIDVWTIIKANAGQPAVLLEEDQYRYLIGRLGGFRWGHATEDAAAFVRALQTAEQFNPNDAKEAP